MVVNPTEHNLPGNVDTQQGIERLKQHTPVIVATDNLIKRKLFSQAIPETVAIDSPFNEDRISEIVERELGGKTLNYPAAVSRLKVEETREALKTEGFHGNAIIFGIDSVLLVPTKPGSNSLRIRNRGDVDEPWMEEEARKRDTMILTAGVSAGSIDGTIYTTQIYIKVPVKPGEGQLNINFGSLSQIVDTTREAEVGVVKPNARAGAKIEYEMEQVGSIPTDNIDTVMSFMSGAESETLETLREAVLFETILAPIISESITKHPFNTFKYVLGNSPDSELNRGGDCHHFTTDVLEKLDKLDLFPEDNVKIGLWDTDKPALLQGHSNVVLTGNHTRVVADAGITIPISLPYSHSRPFHPSKLATGKEAFLTRTDGRVILVIRRPDQTKMAITPFAGMINSEKMSGYLESVIPPLVAARHSELRWEIHDENGSKKQGFYVDSQGEVKIMQDGQKIYTFSLTHEPNRRQRERINQELSRFGVTLDEMAHVYNRWRRLVTNEFN